MNTQTKLLRECAKRTPIYKPDSPAMEIVGGICLGLFFLIVAFV